MGRLCSDIRACCVCGILCAISQSVIVVKSVAFMLTLQADVSGTIVKWLVENGAQITPGQVSLICSAHCSKNVSEHGFSVHGLLYTMQSVLLSCLRWLSC